MTYLNTIDVLPENQSAYRKHHSTETALVSVASDILTMMDRGECGIIILLDLSAAFDTVVHESLLDDMEMIGIENDAWKLLKSYLENRSFCVKTENVKSDTKTLNMGVPQGSVLGPVLFSIYTIELSWILKKHGVKFKFFADDTRFYFVVDGIHCTKEKRPNYD